MTATIKERPILFSGPMVRAILAGRKTQTRRTIERMEGFRVKQFGPSDTTGYDWHFRCQRGLWQDMDHAEVISRCPHGQPGDRLWVREAWSPMQQHRPIANPERYDGKAAWYRADNDRPMWAGSKWKPSIHMPRWASRITLEITNVRVERLNEISEEDAKSEGIETSGNGRLFKNYRNNTLSVCLPVFSFMSLWESINGPDSWGSTWVWVVEFKRLEAT